MEQEKENTEERRANSSLEVAGFEDVMDIHFMGKPNVTQSWTNGKYIH